MHAFLDSNIALARIGRCAHLCVACTTPQEYVPALLGLSIAFMLQDQGNKARNTLKRIAKMPYTTGAHV
jgi:hypothetical protein